MLQNIREHIQGWIAGVIIVLLAAAFLLWGVQYYVEASSGQRASVAKVNGTKITEMELQQAYQQLLRRQREMSGNNNFTASEKKQLKQMALQQLISSLALQQSAKDAGLMVSIPQVKQMIVSDPAFQVDGKFSEQKLMQIIYGSNTTPEQFFARVQNSIVVQQLQNGIQGSAFSTDNEIQQAYGLLKQERSFGYFTLPSARFKNDIKITPAEIKNYYMANKAEFLTPEKVSVSYIMLSPKVIADSIKISPKQIKNYYDGNQQNFTVAQRWQVKRIVLALSEKASPKDVKAAQDKIQAIAAQLKKGADFGKLAKQHSGETVITQWLTQDQISGPLAAMINKLKVGDISAPFRTTQGYNIVKLIKMEPSKLKPLASVADNIRKSLRQQQVESIFSHKSDQLSNLTYTNPDTLSVAAKELGLKVHTMPLMTRKQATTGILKNKSVVATVFSADVLKQGNNSTPISLKDGSIVVVRVAKHVPSKEKALSEVSATIKATLATQKMQRKAGLVAYEIQSALKAGQSSAAIAKKYNVIWTEKNNINRADKSINPQLLLRVFGMAVSKAVPKPIASVLLKNGDYAIIQINKVTMPDMKTANKKILKVIGLNMSRFFGQLEYRLYAKGVIDSADVKHEKKI